MAFNLAAVDSPVVGKSLVEHGRVREYLEFSVLPVRVDYSGDEFAFIAAGDAEEKLARLAAAGCDDLCLCFSTDARGRFFTWLLEGFLRQKWGEAPVNKLRLAGLSPELVASAPVDGREFDPVIPVAVLARQELGRKLKFHLRRTLGTGSGPGGLPLSVNAVAMIFTMADFFAVQGGRSGYGVEVEFSGAAGGFKGRLAEMLGHTVSGIFIQPTNAAGCAECLSAMEFTVSNVDRQDCEIEPPPPLTFAALTDAAMTAFGLSPARVQFVLDCLASGNGRGARVSVGYDDCPPRVALEEAIRDSVAVDFGQEILCKRGFSPRDILPVLDPIESSDGLSLEEKEILDLIIARARAWQMAPLKEKVVSVDLVSVDGALVRARDRRMVAAGFTVELAGDSEDGEDPVLFSLEAGMEMTVAAVDVVPEGKDETGFGLLDFWEVMAETGINADRESCRVLERLMDLGYLAFDPVAGFSSLPRLDLLVRGFSRAFPGFPPQSLLPYLEQTVQEVAEGRKGLAEAVSQFDQTLFVHGRILVRETPRIRINLEQRRVSSRIIKGGVAAVIPASGEGSGEEIELTSPVVDETAVDEDVEATVETSAEAEKDARTEVDIGEETERGDENGDWSEEVLTALAAPGPESRPEPVAAVAPVAEKKISTCLECGRTMVRRQYRYGGFWRCHGYPDCQGFQDDAGEALPLCPVCGRGAVISRRTGSGRVFYICSEDACGLTAWSRPHAISCRRCGHPFLVEKKKGEGVILRCPRAGCGYEHNKKAERQQKTSVGKKRRVVVRKGAGRVGGRKVVRVVRRKKRS